MTKSRAGLSRKAKVTVGHSFRSATTSAQGPRGREERIAKAQAVRNAEISSKLISYFPYTTNLTLS